MTILAPKRSNESIVYVFDFAQQLAPTQDTIQSFVLAITAGTITAPVVSQSSTDSYVQALLVGGANGETATLTLAVTTVGGQVLRRDLSLTIADAATAIYPSTTTKGQLRDKAFVEIGLAGYEFDASPEEQASALLQLDAMMAELAGPGSNLNMGYNFAAAMGGSDPTELSGIPDFCFNYAALELALALMPAIGKTMSAETRKRYNQGRNAAQAALAVIPERRLPRSTARGAGAKPFSTWWPYIGTGVN